LIEKEIYPMRGRKKIGTYEEAQAYITCMQLLGFVCVLVTGGFDVLHGGHTITLEEAKEFAERLAKEQGKRGGFLVVGLESDETLNLNKGKKGEPRPIFSVRERLWVLSAIEYIDFLFPFKDVVSYADGKPIYLERLGLLHPNVVFGTVTEGNWEEKKRFIEEEAGIRVEVVEIKDIDKNHSSTSIVEHIRRWSE